MGTICQGRQPEYQMPNYIIPEAPKQNRITSTIMNTHTPSNHFAKPIQDFPQLSQSARRTRNNLPNFEGDSFNNHEKEPHFDQTVFQLSNGTIYQGQWYRGQIHGKGRFYLVDNSYLQCYCEQNQPVGKVRLIKQNGDYFEGHFKEGQAQGEGEYVSRSENRNFKGNFHKNFLDGFGHEEGPGYYFQGKFEHGSKKQGTLVWWNEAQFGNQEPKGKNQDKKCEYTGPFLDEKFHGIGTLKNSIGIFQGNFEHGLKKGFGKFTWKNGARFEGYYMRNMKNGDGKMHNPKGQVILEGRWMDDQPPIAIQAALK